MTLRTITAACTLTLALFMTACAAEAEGDAPAPPAPTQTTEPAAQAPGADEADGADERGGDAVEEIELEGALVESFPNDVPLYDARIVRSLSGTAEVTGQPEWSVTLNTDDAMDVVDAAIREAYSANGWQVASDMEFAGGITLVARGNGYIVSVGYNDLDGNGVTIDYGVSQQ